MKVAIAGASGLIGTEVSQALEARGDEVVKLPRFGTAPWSIEGADAVVNLAGANLGGKRWLKRRAGRAMRRLRTILEEGRDRGRRPTVATR